MSCTISDRLRVPWHPGRWWTAAAILLALALGAAALPGVETQVASGEDFSLVLDADGQIWSRGNNANGQLGNGTQTASPTASVQVLVGSTPFTQAIAIAAGGDYQGSGAGSFALALRADGTVWAWGDNAFGQCGDGTATGPRTSAVQVAFNGGGPLTDVIAISAGVRHGMALRSDGTVWCWGANTAYQLGDRSGINRSGAVQVTWQIFSVTVPLSGVVAIAAGGDHSLALLADGTVRGWGGNASGQVGNNSTATVTSQTVVQASGGAALSGIKAIAAGKNSSMALSTSGQVWTWGSDDYGEIGDGTVGTNRLQAYGVGGAAFGIKAISCGMWGHKWALRYDGALVGWGYNGDGRMGYASGLGNQANPVLVTIPAGTMVRAIGAGRLVSTFQLAGGEVYTCGMGATTPALVPAAWSLTAAMHVAAGRAHSLLLKADGTVWAWGDNGSGQLGDGTTTSRSAPVQVMANSTTPLAGIIAIAAGSNHSMALRADGHVICWGQNSNGQLGNNGAGNSSYAAVSSYDFPVAVAIAAGGYAGYALHCTGYLADWGINNSYQLGDGTTTQQNSFTYAKGSGGSLITNIKQIEGGYSHVVALLGDGTVRTSGSNANGQLGSTTAASPVGTLSVNPSLSSIKQIGAGNYHSIFLSSDGTVRAAGADYAGQLGDGTTNGSTAPVAVAGLSGAKLIATGCDYGDTNYALLANGQARSWGAGSYGQLGNNGSSNSSNIVVIQSAAGVPQAGICDLAAGDFHGVLLLADGTVRSFGQGSTGQLGDGGSTNQPLTVPAQPLWLPSVSSTITDGVASEAGPGTGSVLVTRSLGTTGALTVKLAFSGSAGFGIDYVTSSGSDSITIPPGQSSATLIVTPIDDAIAEDAETVAVTVASGSGYLPGGGGGVISIADNDIAGFLISAANGTTTESGAGNTFSFTIALRSQPLSAVGIAISSLNIQEGTVSISSVIFTQANWNVARTVTVTGVPDNVDDGNQAYTVKLAPAVSSDLKYNGLDPADVAMTSIDVDTAGLVVSAVSGPAKEDGTTATFTVRLATKPSANVTIPVSSADTGEILVSPASLTFTPAGWNNAQTVTCTGVGDGVDDGDRSIAVSIGATASGDSQYQGLTASRTVVNQDIDTADIAIVPKIGSVSEGSGDSDRVTIVLGSKPTGPVTVTVTEAAGQVVFGTTSGNIASPSAVLTFTPANWKVEQYVYVAAVDDDLIDGNVVATISAAGSSGADALYNGMTRTAPETVIDNDAAGVVLSRTSLQTTESTSLSPISDSVTIRLAARPASNVSLTLTLPQVANGEAATANKYEGSFNATVDPGTTGLYSTVVTITPGQWNSGVVVPVYGRRGTIGFTDGNQSYAMSISAPSSTDPHFASLPGSSLPVTNIDVDVPGLTIIQAGGGTSVAEGGSSATYTVQLNTDPGIGNVVIVYPGVVPGGRLAVAPAALVFTSTAGAKPWSSPQTVTVQAVDDQVAQGTSVESITHTTDVSSSANYNAKTFNVLGVPVADNDAAAITVSPAGGLTTTEAGATANFSVVLTSRPSIAVTVPVVVPTTSQGEVEISAGGPYASSASLTFTSGNWNVPRTVIVHGLNDAIDDGDQPFQVEVRNPTAGDANYQSINPPDVSGVNLDDDAAGYGISATTLATDEAGGTAAFTVVLTSRPTAPVTLPIASSNTAEGLVKRHADAAFTATTSITFTTANWSTPQQIDVQGQADQNVDDGDVAYAVLIQADAATADTTYRNREPADVAVTNRNGDAAGVTVSPISGHVSETGSTATFTIVLTSRPTSDVTVPLAPSVSGEVSLSADQVTFTPTGSDWSTPRTITVTGLPDGVDDGNASVTIVVNPAISSDGAYNGLNPADVAVVNDDIDAAGVIVAAAASPAPTIEGGRYVTTEAGAAAAFTVRLACRPRATVEVPFTSMDADEGTVSVNSLTFTTANWNVPQPLVVTGAAGGPAESVVDYGVQVESPVSTDPAYAALVPAVLPMRNKPVNNAPSFSPITDVTLDEATASATPTVLTILDVSTGQGRENQILGFTVASDDPALVPIAPSSLSYSAGDPIAKLTFAPAIDAFGTAHVTVTLADDGGTALGGIDSFTRTFAITVRPVNDAPSFVPGADITVGEDSGAHSGAWATGISAGPANEAAQQLVFTASAAAPALFAVQPAFAADGTLTFTPAANAFGDTTVTVSLHDDGGTDNGGVDASASVTFALHVVSANDAPSFTAGGDIAIPEDGGAQIRTNWATGTSPGPANESAQTVAFTVTATNPGLFSAAPAISPAGTLTFTPAPDSAGRSTVTIRATDNGGVANGGSDTSAPTVVTITIDPVNDPPVAASSAASGRRVSIGGSRVIASSDLSATDVDSAVPAPAADPALVFTLQLIPGAGTLARDGVALQAGDAFTQDDLINGRIRYTHGGGSGATDGFAYIVTDQGIAAGTVSTTPLLPATALAPAVSAPQVFAFEIDRRPPLIVLGGSVPAFTENQTAPVLVADAATVTDSDSTTFVGGTIRARAQGLASAEQEQVELALRDQGTGTDELSIAGSTLRINGQDVGTVSGGSAGSELTVSCTAFMTPVNAQRVIRNLLFLTTSESPATGIDIAVSITDDHGDTSSGVFRTIVVTPVNDAPFASAALVTTVANQPVAGRILVDDVDSTVFTFTVTQQPAKGTISAIAADGTFTYTPATDLSGNDQFTVVVSDGIDSIPGLAVPIRISGPGSPSRPWITSDPPVEARAGDLLRTTIQASTAGLAAGFALEFSLVGAPAGMTVVQSAADTAVLTWTPPSLTAPAHVAFRIRVTETASGTVVDQPVLLYVHPSAGG